MIDKGVVDVSWPAVILVGVLVFALGFAIGLRTGVTLDAPNVPTEIASEEVLQLLTPHDILRSEAVERGLAVWEFDSYGEPEWRWKTDAEMRKRLWTPGIIVFDSDGSLVVEPATGD